MTAPEIEYTQELHDALTGFEDQRLELVVAGVDPRKLDALVRAVRNVDAELVAARHVQRNSDLSPYFPEDYQAEEDGLEDAEKLLRAPLPQRRERGDGERVVVHGCPPMGSAYTPCCNRTPFEVTGRISVDATLVTCDGVSPGEA
ncbi:hypothetical protein ACFW2V_13035 [Streptomyces sp. NPDC058947]|uniref:hypothetical protein n=1 Tax=Streptomyces sp. NPDC058947 TaxID=3346675 RepID=UPI0036860733